MEVALGRRSLVSERRSQLIDAYYRCIARRGLESCTMKSIAREAGMATSIVTHYFGTMEELTREFISRFLEMYKGLIFNQLEEAKDPEEKLEKLLSILFSEEILTDDFNRAYTDVLHHASQDNKVRVAVREAMQDCYSILIDTFKEVAEPKTIPAEDLKRMAVTVMSLATGTLIHKGVSPDIVCPSMALDMALDLLKSFLKGSAGINRIAPEAARGIT